MARALAELEKDISALNQADKEKLLDFLMLDIDPPEELKELVRELDAAVDRTSRSLEQTLAYLEGLDERMARERIRAQEEVLRSDYRWPFSEPPQADPD